LKTTVDDDDDDDDGDDDDELDILVDWMVDRLLVYWIAFYKWIVFKKQRHAKSMSNYQKSKSY
jgi:hypothetical protein